MSQHFITTPIKLATCNRCGAYLWTCHTEGFRAAADPIPLADLDAYVAALAAGRQAYEVQTLAGRPERLRMVSRSTPLAERLAAGRLVASHDCGTRSMNATAAVTEVPDPKGPASCVGATVTRAYPSDGVQRHGAPSRAVRGPHSQSLYCALCQGPVSEGGPPFWGLDLGGAGRYAEHLRCP